MSAFVQDAAHIDYLLSAARKFTGLRDTEDLFITNIGRKLIAENVASVNYRYDEEEESTEEYAFQPTPLEITAIDTLKAVRGYMYQSCEHAEWESSFAKMFCDWLTEAAEATLPESWLRIVRTYGYDEPYYRTSGEWEQSETWSITDSDVERGE